jgi:hypothetical protein
VVRRPGAYANGGGASRLKIAKRFSKPDFELGLLMANPIYQMILTPRTI